MTTSRTVLVRLKANADPFVREMAKAKAAVRDVRNEIDTTTDRSAWLAQGILALAPAATTMGATAIPVLMGLATQATVAVGAIGAIGMAFNGVGDAVGALNDYQLEPTAKNLAKLQEAMSKIGPDGEQFVRFLDSIGPKWAALGMDARAGMFPGMQDGIESLMTRLPELRRIVSEVSAGVGELSADAGAGLASGEFDAFFEYLESDAKTILVEMGQTLGNFLDGFASLMVAFGPLTREFSSGFLGMSRDFEQWAEDLDQTDGFETFVQYVRDNGPAVMDLLGSLGTALVELTEAAAPVGAVMVPTLTLLADALAAVADTPIGSIAILGAALTSLYGRMAALSSIAGGGLLGLATKEFRGSAKAAKAAVPSVRDFGNAMVYSAHSQGVLTTSLNSGSKAASTSAKRALEARRNVVAFGKAAGPAAAQVGLLAASLTGVAESADLGNTAMGGLLGSTLSKRAGVIGAAIGLTMDLTAANKSWEDSVRGINAAMESGNIDQMEAELKSYSQLLETLPDELMSVGVFYEATREGFRGLGSWLTGDGYTTALMDAVTAANDLALEIKFLKGVSGEGWDGTGIQRALVGPLVESGRQAEIATASIEKLRAEYGALLGLLTKQGAWDAYQAAIDAASESVKEHGRTLDSNTEAGRANRAELYNIAETALTFSEQLTGMDRIDYLKNARRAFVAAAEDMGGLDKRAREVLAELDKLIGVNGKPKIDDKDIRDAKRSADDLVGAINTADKSSANPWVRLYGVPDAEAALANLTRSRNVAIKVHFTRTPLPAGSTPQPSDIPQPAIPRKGSADGSTVPKTGLPYADRHPYLLADGEEVISNRHGQADRGRRAAKLINAGALTDAMLGLDGVGGPGGLPPAMQTQDMFALASGGSVGSWRERAA